MRISILDDGLDIHFKGDVRLVPWENIDNMKEYSFATATRLSEIDGRTLIYAFDNMKNFSTIKEILSESDDKA